MEDNPLRIEYGPVEARGFYFWFIGGESFENCPGDFEGPFLTLEEARRAASKVAEAEQLSIYLDPRD
jgi:hypothetical protein